MHRGCVWYTRVLHLLLPKFCDLPATRILRPVEPPNSLTASPTAGHKPRRESVVQLASFHASEILIFIDVEQHGHNARRVFAYDSGTCERPHEGEHCTEKQVHGAASEGSRERMGVMSHQRPLKHLWLFFDV